MRTVDWTPPVCPHPAGARVFKKIWGFARVLGLGGEGGGGWGFHGGLYSPAFRRAFRILSGGGGGGGRVRDCWGPGGLQKCTSISRFGGGAATNPQRLDQQTFMCSSRRGKLVKLCPFVRGGEGGG